MEIKNETESDTELFTSIDTEENSIKDSETIKDSNTGVATSGSSNEQTTDVATSSISGSNNSFMDYWDYIDSKSIDEIEFYDEYKPEE